MKPPAEYHILCPRCPGALFEAETLRQALRTAKRETPNHRRCGGEVWVAFEGACQKGQPRLWHANGEAFRWHGIDPPPITGTVDGHRFEVHFPASGTPFVEYPDASLTAELDFVNKRTLWRDADTGDLIREDSHDA